MEDGEGGFQADTGGSGRVTEKVVEDVDGEGDEGFHFFTDEEGAVVLGVRESFLERGFIATPVADGVAMDAGFAGGFGRGGAAGQGVYDLELLGGKQGNGHANQPLIRA